MKLPFLLAGTALALAFSACNATQDLGGGGGSTASAGACDPTTTSSTSSTSTSSSTGSSSSSSMTPPATCTDDVKNGAETDVDCGGPACPPCATGKECAVGSDCIGSVCVSGVCAASSCADGVKNGTETDVDCGGSVCPTCALGKSCLVGADCTSADCTANVCQSGTASSCTDGVKNGAETDVDCGGGACPPCVTGKECSANSDCIAADFCAGGHCQTVDACADGVQDGAETDVDCGGSTCAQCATGKSCIANADCLSSDCVANVCHAAAASCTDGVKNGAETDVDCGGGTCPACAASQECKVDADCLSDACDAVTPVCVTNQCADHRLDGAETDVDCGGGTCPSCAVAKKCLVDTDCASNACDALSLVCVASQCADHAKDGLETDVDCGGGICASCTAGTSCHVGSDCLSGTCTGSLCQ